MSYKRVKKVKNLPVYQRPREKLISNGVSNLSNQELLAIILGNGSKKASVLQLAELILNKFPLHHLAMADINSLCQIVGIGASKACKILACLELGQRSGNFNQQWKIDKPQKIIDLMAELKNKKQEHCYAFYINGRQELLEKKLLALGGLNASSLDQRSLFAPAIALACPFIVLLHNHPSGNYQPSQSDLDTTAKLKQASEILDIHLLDHLIISQGGYYSFKEAGVL